MTDSKKIDFEKAPFSQETVLNPTWVSQALSVGRSEPVTVKKVELIESIGFSCLILRVKLTYEGNPDLPREVSIKGLFDPASAAYINEFTSTGVLIAEASFYSQLAPVVGMQISACYFAGIDEEKQNGVIIVDDLKHLNARFFTGKDNLSLDQIRQTLTDLARLHAWSSRQEDHSYPWLKTKFQGWATGTGKLTADQLTSMLQGPRGEHLPNDIRNGERMLNSMQALYQREAHCATNFIHGDDHCGNLHELNGKMGFHDWQTIQRGNWSLDVAYHMAAALTIEGRRKHEIELLRFYLERVAEFNGEVTPWEKAWELYRQSTAYGYFMWGITQRVSDDIVNANVSRLGTAVADHASYTLLRV